MASDQRDQLFLVKARITPESTLFGPLLQFNDRPSLVGAGSAGPEFVGSGVPAGHRAGLRHTGVSTRGAGAAKRLAVIVLGIDVHVETLLGPVGLVALQGCALGGLGDLWFSLRRGRPRLLDGVGLRHVVGEELWTSHHFQHTAAIGRAAFKQCRCGQSIAHVNFAAAGPAMKVAMVAEHASPLAVAGGVGVRGQSVHVAELSAALARLGHQVTVYARRDDPRTPQRVDTPQGYTVFHVPAGPPGPLPKGALLDHMGEFVRCLDAHWSADRPDVAHAHFWTSGIAAQLAARAHRIPTVQTFHALGVVRRRHQGRQNTTSDVRLKLEKLLARDATWVAATCTDEVFELSRMGRARSRVSVVPGGVDLDTFTTDGPAAPRGSLQRIVAVGPMSPRKGFDTMIEALPSIAAAEYVIVGGPDAGRIDGDPEVRRLRQLAGRLGVADRVRFTGAVAHADMPALLRSADVVTSTPWFESFGIVALEAMACGVPVVASAVGGMLDTVVHDVTGRLVPALRPKACAEAVSGILRDAFLRRSLGLAGRDRACARYSWDRVAHDTLRMYERMADAAIGSYVVRRPRVDV